jgi:RND family efflux transporter MFP subunit
MSNEEIRSEHEPHGVPVHQPEAMKHEAPPVKRGSMMLVLFLVLVVAAVLAVFGILKRKHSEKSLDEYTQHNAAPPVTLQKPVLQQSAREIVIPGNMQAFTVAPIYARTTGYVKTWTHDIGSHVHKGDLLAIIETPELDQQLEQAKADLATAKANAGLAKVTAGRYNDLIGSNAVSQQDTDNAVSQAQARNTEVTSAEAAVHRIEELQSFERIVAPFDGVITARNVDIGQLISATGSTTSTVGSAVSGSKEIFDMAAINTLRVFVNVPQVYSPDARKGVTATLTLPQYPGRTFKGTLVRTSNAVDPSTRTLLAEVDVDNRSGELLPGSYTEVHLNTSNAAPALVVPVSAVILESNGLNVATVDGSNHAHIVHVVPGRDSGSTIEILSGLPPDQMVIANPPDSLTDGELVSVVNDTKGKPAQPAGSK